MPNDDSLTEKIKAKSQELRDSDRYRALKDATKNSAVILKNGFAAAGRGLARGVVGLGRTAKSTAHAINRSNKLKKAFGVAATVVTTYASTAILAGLYTAGTINKETMNNGALVSTLILSAALAIITKRNNDPFVIEKEGMSPKEIDAARKAHDAEQTKKGLADIGAWFLIYATIGCLGGVDILATGGHPTPPLTKPGHSLASGLTAK